MLELSDGKELRIWDTVIPVWKYVAISLGFTRAMIRSIEVDRHYIPKDATFEMFKVWLNGAHSELKPATWTTLVQSLKDVKFTEIADMLYDLVCCNC